MTREQAEKHLGKDHAEWFVKKDLEFQELLKHGAWLRNDLEDLAAYVALMKK